MAIKSGVMNGPKRLPTVTLTIVAATSPPAWRVMTTFELMVVGKHPVAMNPTSMLISIDGFFEAAQAMAKKTEEVMRNEVI